MQTKEFMLRLPNLSKKYCAVDNNTVKMVLDLENINKGHSYLFNMMNPDFSICLKSTL